MNDKQEKLPEPLTESELAEIEARCNAASTAPWTFSYHSGHYDDVIALESTPQNQPATDVLLCTGDDDESWGEISPEDAAFIEHARTDIPKLIAASRSVPAPADERVVELIEAAKAISMEWVDSDELIELRKQYGDADGQTARILRLRAAIDALEAARDKAKGTKP